MEVSAKENININELFTQLAMTIIDNLEKELQQAETPSGRSCQRKQTNIMINRQEEKKKDCC